LKLKFTKSDDFIVVGFTRVKGSWRNFGALLLAYMDEGQLVYRVGSGPDSATARFHRPEARSDPKRGADLRGGEGVFCVGPELFVEVNSCSWTKKAAAAQSFKGLREDKRAMN